MNTLGLYIHVPFCGKKCSYCDFYSVSYNRDVVNAYVDSVIRNIKHYSDFSCTTDTVYFGGGTPSLLSAEQISMIINEIDKNFNLDKNAEITLEANPNTINPDKLNQMRDAGVNRISIGVQSLVDEELKFLGRTHTSERALQAVKDAQSAGFENISCDLMLGIPCQTTESLEYSINSLASLSVQHVSAYILKTEKGTPFDCEEIQQLLPDEDTTSELYLDMVNLLDKHGLCQYEVSNFALKGFESRHNCRYWKCFDYIGIGPSAHSCYDGKRFAVERNLDDFISSDVQTVEITDESPCGFEEYAMLRLRLKEGLNILNTGSHQTSIEKKIPLLIKAGYAEFDGEFLSLTPKGFLMSNSVIEFLVFE